MREMGSVKRMSSAFPLSAGEEEEKKEKKYARDILASELQEKNPEKRGEYLIISSPPGEKFRHLSRKRFRGDGQGRREERIHFSFKNQPKEGRKERAP